MQIANQAAWDAYVASYTGDYGARIVRYAEDLANLIEERTSGLSEYYTFEQLAEDMIRKARNPGTRDEVTDNMVAAGVKILSDVWVNGEALRLAYNKSLGVENLNSTPGAVANPAVMDLWNDGGRSELGS